MDCAADKYPCFIVNDLREDDRFAHLPVVDGTVMAYRFYAGTPITTDHGINIGSFFMFDDRPRPEGLTVEQRKCLSSPYQLIIVPPLL
jgi:GAF domain-containing protein